MPKYTKYLEFSQKERTAIRERDNYRCIFCQIGYTSLVKLKLYWKIKVIKDTHIQRKKSD